MRCRVVQGAVESALRKLRRRPVKVDVDGVALDGQLDRVSQHLTQGVVGDHRAVFAVGQGTDGLSHGPLRQALHHLRQSAQILHAVVGHKGEYPFGTNAVGGDK